MMFKGKLKHGLLHKAKDPSTPNPYTNARRVWNNHNGSVMSANQLLSVLALLGMLIGLAAVGGMTYIGSLSKFIPIAFLQDSQGNVVSATRGDRIQEASVDDYRTAAASFIEDIRLVTPDVSLQRKAVFRLYAKLNPNDPATAKANEYLNGNPDATPFEKARKQAVSIDIQSVLLQDESSHAWAVEWDETVRDRQGALLMPTYRMKAIVRLYQTEPTKDTKVEDLLKNPKFIFVRDYDWANSLIKVNK